MYASNGCLDAWMLGCLDASNGCFRWNPQVDASDGTLKWMLSDYDFNESIAILTSQDELCQSFYLTN